MSAPNLFDLIRREDFDAAREAKLINERDDGAGLRILNYSDAALYTPGAWDNPAVRFCRGVIVDEHNRLSARPWQKFFNYGQTEAGALPMDEPVEVTDKLDGSLGIIHISLDGVARVASRGSFESDQARHATRLLHSKYTDIAGLVGITPLVEIIYPANRIVVDYGDQDDLTLLGGVEVDTGAYLGPQETARRINWSGPTTQVFNYPTLREALAAGDRPGMEGLCVRYLHEPRIVKVKQDDYVRLHRIVTGLSERTVWEHMVAEKPIEDLLAPLPDELHDWTREVWNRIDLAALSTEGRARDAHNLILDRLESDFERREYAEAAKAKAPLTPLLFQLLDRREIRPGILRGLKPAGDTRAKSVSEAVA